MDRVRSLLQCHWISFALLIGLGLLDDLFFSPYGSGWESVLQHPGRYAYLAGHVALFGIMVAAPHLNRKALWWVSITIISLKLYCLLKYYALFNYYTSSSFYHRDYIGVFYRLQHVSHWFMFAGNLLFGNHAVSAAFLATLYVYWLVQCRKLLHAKSVE